MQKRKAKKNKKCKIAVQEPKPDAKLLTTGQFYKRVAIYDKLPVFSFLSYEHSNSQLSALGITNCSDFHKFFKEIQSISTVTWGTILYDQKDYYHAHELDWEKTTKKSGFPKTVKSIPEAAQPVQFKVFEECRIIGYFNLDVFYIVWIDRGHTVCNWEKAKRQN